MPVLSLYIYLNRDAMIAIEKAGDMRTQYLRLKPPIKKRISGIPIDSVFRGDIFSPFDAPLRLNSSPPVLGDRVVNITSSGVPFGLIGTVVSIHTNTGYVEVNNETMVMMTLMLTQLFGTITA
jgi:hypothetical protein